MKIKYGLIGVALTGLSFLTFADASGSHNLKMYTFDCGTINVSDMDVFSSSGDYAKSEGNLTNTCYLIRHPQGDLLWDAGLPASLASSDPMINGVFTLSLNKTLVEQFEVLGMKPNDVEYISISHSHFDHVGQVSSFSNALWLAHENEVGAMFKDEKSSEQYVDFANLKRKTFKGDFDVFGDGRVVIMELPGHTAGHTSLKVEFANAGTVMLSGDLYHQTKSRELRRVPRFNVDEAKTHASMDMFEKVVKETNARVIIQHEKNDIKTLPKPPLYID